MIETQTMEPGPDAGDGHRAEESRRRRTVAFLVASLVIMLLLLCALGYFYVKLVGPADEYEPAVQDGYGIQFIKEYYGFGKGANEQFNRPRDVSVTPEGDMLISDSQNGRVAVVTLAGELVAQVGADQEWGSGNLDMPNGAAAGADGRMYVADGGSRGPHGKLIIYTPEFSRVETEVFFPPRNPPITPRVFGDEVYVTCAMGVKVYDLDGNLLREWGDSIGKQDEQFSYPNGIVRRQDGSVVVAESNNRRIKFYDSRGTLESIVGTPPADSTDQGVSRFTLPMGLAEDEGGKLYVSDAWAYNIRVLDRDGEELAALGDYGSGSGQFDAPAGIAYLGDREFLIADELNHRIVRARITVPGQGGVLEIGAGESGLVRTCMWVVPLLVILLIIGYIIARSRKRRNIRMEHGEL